MTSNRACAVINDMDTNIQLPKRMYVTCLHHVLSFHATQLPTASQHKTCKDLGLALMGSSWVVAALRTCLARE